jgi:hypothetical protein
VRLWLGGEEQRREGGETEGDGGCKMEEQRRPWLLYARRVLGLDARLLQTAGILDLHAQDAWRESRRRCGGAEAWSQRQRSGATRDERLALGFREVGARLRLAGSSRSATLAGLRGPAGWACRGQAAEWAYDAGKAG